MSDKKFLIDTSIWIKCFREADSTLHSYISSLVIGKKVYISELIALELLRGAKSDKEYNMLYEDLLALPIIELTRDVWEVAYKLSYKLRKKGVNAPLADILISSIALHYKCTLLHSDRHFKLIAKHTALNEQNL
jgi:predicted nucleic acid-binding protein